MDDTASNCDYQSPKPTPFTLILNKPITNSQEAVVYLICVVLGGVFVILFCEQIGAQLRQFSYGFILKINSWLCLQSLMTFLYFFYTYIGYYIGNYRFQISFFLTFLDLLSFNFILMIIANDLQQYSIFRFKIKGLTIINYVFFMVCILMVLFSAIMNCCRQTIDYAQIVMAVYTGLSFLSYSYASCLNLKQVPEHQLKLKKLIQSGVLTVFLGAIFRIFYQILRIPDSREVISDLRISGYWYICQGIYQLLTEYLPKLIFFMMYQPIN